MNSNQRIMEIFLSLYQEERFSIKEASSHYNVSMRTLQRDLAAIKDAINSNNINLELIYNSKQQVYTLKNLDRLSAQEILVISKILLESRAFPKEELEKITNHLLRELSDTNNKTTKKFVANELLNYVPLNHQIKLLKLVKEFMHYISDMTVLDFDYRKNKGEIVKRKGLPVSIYFSEYYFYIILYNPTYQNHLHYRLDRFLSIRPSSEKIKIPYKDRLEDSELRKTMFFMYAGKPVTFTFQFWGIVDAALDKLPNSKLVKYLDDDSVIIEATAYDTGVMMWLLSQGSNVKVLTPALFVKKIENEIAKMLKRYEN